MKTLMHLLLVSFFLVFASAAHAEAIQIFNCEFEGDATDDEVFEMAEKWLNAARQLKGGKNLQLFIRHPIAASVDDVDFKLVIAAPSFAEWGEFTDVYEASAIVEIDDEFEKVASCNEASMWEGEEIK